MTTPTEPTPPGRRSTLLIEDDARSAALIEAMLASAGPSPFQLEHVTTLADGLRRLADGPCHLVLLDLALPDSKGFDSFAKIAAAAPDVAIVVITGTDDETLAVRAVQEGAQDYLVKGRVDGPLLLRSMSYAVERKAAQTALRQAHESLERRVAERTAELSEANRHLQREIQEHAQAEKALLESKQMLEGALLELRQTQQQVIQRERLHALGSMASGLAHDFNNALAPILGFSDLLLLHPNNREDPEKLEKYLQMIRSSAQDAAEVVGRLRAFSGERDPDQPVQPVDLNALLAQVINLTKPHWRDQALARGITIRIDTDFGAIPPVRGVASDLRQLFTNLIFNAADAMRSDGAVSVRTRSLDNQVLAEIHDEGEGMPDPVRQRCFEPFFTTKGDHGSGFGLPISYGIVERHRGHIELETSPGLGTTVRVRLPSSVAPAQPVAAPGFGEHGSLHILVADDEPLMREVIVACLTADGHTVETAAEGREALGKFKASVPDLVITDRAMPGMNGDQLAAAIKESDPGMFVIMLTGFGQLMQTSGEVPPAVDLVVSKPFTMEDLRKTVARGAAALRERRSGGR